MNTITVIRFCPSCETFWKQKRVKPLKKNRPKTCPNCLKRGDGYAEELGGNDKRSCSKCKFFKDSKDLGTNEYWKECSKNRKGRMNQVERDPCDEENFKVVVITSELVYIDDCCPLFEATDETNTISE